jgi:hypothetical protein
MTNVHGQGCLGGTQLDRRLKQRQKQDNFPPAWTTFSLTAAENKALNAKFDTTLRITTKFDI